MRKIGISAVSLFPLSWGPWGPAFLGWFYRKTGIPVQLVPLLGFTKEGLRKHVPSEAVISYEGAWNEGESFAQLWKRISGKDPAAIIGFLLFGLDRQVQTEKVAWFRELYPEAFAVDLGGTSNRDLREVSTNETWKSAPRLAYDTLHRKEAGITDIAATLLMARSKLVHLQTRERAEFHALCKGKVLPRSLAYEMILIRSTAAPVIIEVPPQFLWPRPVKKSLIVAENIAKLLERS